MTRIFIVKVTVSDNWMDGGFELTVDNMESIFGEGLSAALPHAYGGETDVVVTAAPQSVLM